MRKFYIYGILLVFVASLALASSINVDKPDRISRFKLITFADSPYTILSSDDILGVNANGGNIVINLPLANTMTTNKVYIKRVNAGANTITINATAPNNIEDNASISLVNKWDYVLLISAGNLGGGWFILDRI